MDYFFKCPDGREMAGCVERLCCYSPFIAPRRHPNGQPMVDQRSGQPIIGPDAQKTWNWLVQQGYPLPQGVSFECIITNPAQKAERSPYIYCVQYTIAQATRAPIQAPYADPVGNRGNAPPPMAGPAPIPGVRTPNSGTYETLPDGALPSNSDPMLGEIDGAGGTFTDIDAQGNEIPRQMVQAAGVPVQQRAHQ